MFRLYVSCKPGRKMVHLIFLTIFVLVERMCLQKTRKKHKQLGENVR